MDPKTEKKRIKRMSMKTTLKEQKQKQKRKQKENILRKIKNIKLLIR